MHNFATLPLRVVGTVGVATLQRRLAAHFARHLPLRVIEAPFEMPPLLPVMVWPRYRAHDPAHAGLWQCLLDCAAGLDGGLHAGLAVGPGAVPDQPVLAP